MKLVNFIKKNMNYIFLIFIVILVFYICISLNLNEPLRNKNKNKNRNRNRNDDDDNVITSRMGNRNKNKNRNKKYKCKNPKPCSSSQETLYKCLNKNDIKNSTDYHIFKECNDSGTKYERRDIANSKIKEIKCKINDDCDNNLKSYTCINKKDKNKIKKSNNNGWIKNFDDRLHESCNVWWPPSWWPV